MKQPVWFEWIKIVVKYILSSKKVICNLQKKKLEYKKLWMIYKKND